MSFFSFFAAFLLVQRLIKSLKFSPLRPKWYSLLRAGLLIIAGLFLISQLIFGDIAAEFIGAATLGGILYYLEQQEDFYSWRPFFRSHYPLIGVTALVALIHLIFHSFYQAHHSAFQLSVVAAWVWVYARSINTRKQREELRIAEERKAELESLIAERTAEITRQRNELQKTVEELKATQAQLIQQEKLASLGELTAGIAHEIQNPLNFVNNFSEVSIELADEIENELENGDTEEVLAIVSDIKQNLEKIHHHGKRADSIVKGMLQHSRASTGQKEPTDINALADEYLRLSYHGLRAKDKSFNAEMVTGFAAGLPPVKAIAQDVGRVLLNLFNNAFYAVQQKQKTAEPGYRPTVEVSTALNGRQVVITVKDNGTGIPAAIREKIMQPFFTTKPTGEGTGLGLSLSYDIVVKGHGGVLDVRSAEGSYTEFIISLPL